MLARETLMLKSNFDLMDEKFMECCIAGYTVAHKCNARNSISQHKTQFHNTKLNSQYPKLNSQYPKLNSSTQILFSANPAVRISRVSSEHSGYDSAPARLQSEFNQDALFNSTISTRCFSTGTISVDRQVTVPDRF